MSFTYRDTNVFIDSESIVVEHEQHQPNTSTIKTASLD
jgi:hypothetical protein